MRKLHGLVALAGAACLMTGAAFAQDDVQVQSYAHPTLFGSSAQETVSADSNYVVGGKVLKSANKILVSQKANVAVTSWSKDVLDTIKANTNSSVWNPKMPILRSELAVVLAEGLSIRNASSSSYTDIADTYWAKNWIDRALAAKVMIGYPDSTFKPDQPVTKAEVFATIAQLINVDCDANATPAYAGADVKYIPNWAVPATNEVIASGLLAGIPNQDKIVSDEYLSKEQVASLVGYLRQEYISNFKVNGIATQYTPTVMTVKLAERLSAKTSNVGDKFIATTTDSVILEGQAFAAGSKVRGEIVEVSRPGVKNPGYLRLKFTEISDGSSTVEFPKTLSEAQAENFKNPNFIARLLGAPFSAAGRIVGVTGRTVGSGVDVIGNGLEQFGDNLSNALVNTLTLHPISGARSLGGSVITLGKGVYDIGKLLVSGVFGVVYEFTDEVVYLVLPSLSEESSLNAGEELVIVY